MTNTTGEKFIFAVTSSDAAVFDHNGLCLNSIDKGKIGITKNNLINDQWAKTEEINEEITLLANLNDDKEIFAKLAELLISNMQQQNSSGELIDQFIIQLLNENFSEKKEFFEGYARLLGLNLTVYRSAILIRLKGFSQELQSQPFINRMDYLQSIKNKIWFAFNNFFTRDNDLFMAYLGTDDFVLFKKVEQNQMENFSQIFRKVAKDIFTSVYPSQNLIFSLGKNYCGLEGLINSLKDAQNSLKVSQQFPNQKDNQINEFQIILENDEKRKHSLATECLSKLTDEKLLRTLETFFSEQLNVNMAAKKLSIHPNTVTYRLKLIKEKIGLDPRVFNEASRINLALITLRLTEH